MEENKRVCLYCGKPLEGLSSWRVYCNDEHYRLHKAQKKLERERIKKEKEAAVHPCKCCGKLIPERKTFCNNSCAATYNNVHRERKPWTAEQKRSFSEDQYKRYNGGLSKEIVLKQRQEERERNLNRRVQKEQQSAKVEAKHCCKYCETALDSNHVELCSECRKYIGYLPSFRRLGFLTKGKSLQESWYLLRDYLVSLYTEEKLGAPEIWKRTGICFRTLQKILKSENLNTRSHSEAVQNAIDLGRLNIPKNIEGYRFRCGKHVNWEGKEFWLRSSYEFDFAKELDSKKIPYLVEAFKIKYFNTRLNRICRAIPDFYLPNTGELIEIKSPFTLKGKVQEMKEKFKAYKEKGFKPVLILNREVKDIFLLTEENIQ